MQLVFPYLSESADSLGRILTIKTWIPVKSPHGWISLSFLFDTGADMTSLPASTASKLGVDVNKCPKITMIGYEGTPVHVYKSEIILHMFKKEIAIPCLFHPNEDVPLLLGRAGIVDYFTITLDAKKKQIVFLEIS